VTRSSPSSRSLRTSTSASGRSRGESRPKDPSIPSQRVRGRKAPALSIASNRQGASKGCCRVIIGCVPEGSLAARTGKRRLHVGSIPTLASVVRRGMMPMKCGCVASAHDFLHRPYECTEPPYFQNIRYSRGGKVESLRLPSDTLCKECYIYYAQYLALDATPCNGNSLRELIFPGEEVR